jgi:ribA/ribD-fused uncharacterized protein
MSDEKFTFFYGGPFSNWLACDFEVDGVKYVSTEQYMMAEKARLFGDKIAADEIMATTDPQKAKIWGRKVGNFDAKVWNEKARDIVYKGCHAKFKQNIGLFYLLMDTDGTTLVEASPTDQIWGIGWGDDDKEALSRDTWQGSNWLGEVLTKVREDLKVGTYKADDYKWSDGSVSQIPVNVFNSTHEELWIWDVDKIRRWASQLGNDFHDIREIDVIVSESDGFMSDPIMVSIHVIKNDGRRDHSQAESFTRDLLVTFKKAVEEVRKELAKDKQEMKNK